MKTETVTFMTTLAKVLRKFESKYGANIRLFMLLHIQGFFLWRLSFVVELLEFF